MTNEIEADALKLLDIHDFRTLTSFGRRKVESLTISVGILDKVNENLAIDFANHVLSKTLPDHIWHRRAGGFLLNKIFIQSDLEASMVIASRMLYDTRGPLKPYHQDALNFVADNLQRFDRMDRVESFFPALVVQFATEPNSPAREISAGLLKLNLQRKFDVDPLKGAELTSAVFGCSLQMVNQAERDILVWAHSIQPKVAQLDQAEGTALTLHVNLFSQSGSEQQRQAQARVLQILETILRDRLNQTSTEEKFTFSRASALQEVLEKTANEDKRTDPVWLATNLLVQGTLSPGERPYMRLRKFLDRACPLLPEPRQTQCRAILNNPQPGLLRSPDHPARIQLRANEGDRLARSHRKYLAPRSSRLAGFMPLVTRTAVQEQPQ